MDADPKFDALVRRDPSVALDHRPLDFNGAVHCVDDTPELDNCAVAGALDDPAVVHGDGRIDQVASERPQPRQNPVLVGSGEPRVADNVGHQDRGQFSRLAHGVVRRGPFQGVSASRPSEDSRQNPTGLLLFGLGMAALPRCTREDVEAGSAALRVDWPVYPRRA
jgi:hypothetical protein